MGELISLRKDTVEDVEQKELRDAFEDLFRQQFSGFLSSANANVIKGICDDESQKVELVSYILNDEHFPHEHMTLEPEYREGVLVSLTHTVSIRYEDMKGLCGSPQLFHQSISNVLEHIIKRILKEHGKSTDTQVNGQFVGEKFLDVYCHEAYKALKPLNETQALITFISKGCFLEDMKHG